MEAGKAVTIKIVTLTPEIAAAMTLEPGYLNLEKIEAIAAVMRAGGWEPLQGNNMVTIRDGVVVDGRHRIPAVVAAGVPVSLAVNFTKA